MPTFNLRGRIRRSLRYRIATATLGVVATGSVVSAVMNAPGVYHQQTDVIFMWPEAQTKQNSFEYASANLIRTAGIIGTIASESDPGDGLASDTATLVGTGVTHGYAVRLPNTGGQWALSYQRPVLNVEAVGRSPKEVADTMHGILTKIDQVLLDQQQDLGVTQPLMVRTTTLPLTPRMEYSEGSRHRAMLITVLLGLGLTSATTTGAGRLAARRRPDGSPEVARRRPEPVPCA